jgi:phosphatidylserine/phosphatidylglycerophosphate/cardiolipin synthase-like enzyme
MRNLPLSSRMRPSPVAGIAWQTNFSHPQIISNTPVRRAPPADFGATWATLCARSQATAAAGGVRRDLMLSCNNTVEALLCGTAEIFTAMRRLIATARCEVLLQCFVWQDGCTAATQLQAGLEDLLAAQRARQCRGEPVAQVDVHIFLRHPPSWMPHSVTGQLEAFMAQADAKLVRLQLWAHCERGLDILHSKSLVVDGGTAIITGANPEHHNDAGHSWFDTGCQVRGGVAQGLRADALDVWAHCRRRVANVAAHLPLPATLLPAQAPVGAKVPMLLVSRRADARPWSRSNANPQNQAILTALQGAQKLIQIMTPNLNVAAVIAALAEAAKRGVRCEILLPHRFDSRKNSRLALQGGGNEHTVRALYARLKHLPQARAMVTVCWFSANGISAACGNKGMTSHAKGLCVDRHLTLMSSCNLDHQSFYRSREIGILMNDAVTAQRWSERLFMRNFLRGIESNEFPRRHAGGAAQGDN